MKQQKEADDYLQFLCQTFTVSNQYTNHDAVALTHMRLSWNKPLDSARLCTAVRRTTQRSFKDICTLRFKHGKQPLFFEVLASKDQRWLQHWHVYYSLDILLLVFFFYLYVFVKIKEIFSCTPSCSHFFAALKKKGNTRNVSKLREAQREDMSTQSQSLWLTAVSVSSCRGEPGRKSHSCRTWLSSAGHSTQQHLHVLGVCGGRWPWPAAWTLVFITHREGCGWREIGLKCCSVTVTAKTQPTVKPTIVTLTSSKWTKKCHAVKVIFVSLHYRFPRCIYTEK